ncbi:MAG: IS1595 family transposase [Aquisalimonadaceae bacterium]
MTGNVVPDSALSSEAGARSYLGSVCWDGRERFCPRCHSRELYRLASGRSRCKRCRYTFGEFAGRWLSQSRLRCRDWVNLARLFEAERPLEEIARELGRAYATVFHAVTLLRAGIMAHSHTCSALLESNPMVYKGLCGHRGHKSLRIEGHAPVFGIRERAGTVSVPVLADIDPDFVLSLPVKKVRHGNIVYTGQVTIYDTVLFALVGKLNGAATARFARSPVHIDRTTGFWAYASNRLATHHGISAEHFPLYLKELEFRYNHRKEAIAPLLLHYLCDFVPSSTH